MSVRLVTWMVWGLAAASAVCWAILPFASPVPVPAVLPLALNGPQDGADWSRVLGPAPVAAPGLAPAAPPAATRFRLTGVVATTTSHSHGETVGPGVALIAVDGGPARAFRVGDPLDQTLSLWSVALRSVRVGDRSGSGPAAFVLELPRPVAAAAGPPPGSTVR